MRPIQEPFGFSEIVDSPERMQALATAHYLDRTDRVGCARQLVISRHLPAPHQVQNFLYFPPRVELGNSKPCQRRGDDSIVVAACRRRVAHHPAWQLLRAENLQLGREDWIIQDCDFPSLERDRK